MNEHYALKDLTEELTTWQALERKLSEEYDVDPSELLDTLEGETDLVEAVRRLDDFIVRREIEIIGLTHHVTAMQLKKARRQTSLDTLRNTILQAMDRAGIPKIETTTGVFTAKRTPRALVIEDESTIPAEYWKAQDPTLDKKGLKEALKNNREVLGATLNNGGITLQIRRS